MCFVKWNWISHVFWEWSLMYYLNITIQKIWIVTDANLLAFRWVYEKRLRKFFIFLRLKSYFQLQKYFIFLVDKVCFVWELRDKNYMKLWPQHNSWYDSKLLTTNRVKRKPEYSCIICIIGGSILMSIWFCNRNRQNAGLSSVLSKMHGVIIKFSNTIVFLCVIIVSCCFCCCLPNNWKLNTFVTNKNTWNLRCIYTVCTFMWRSD